MIKDKSILIKNIYYMLTYAFQVLKQNSYEEIAKEDFDNIQNLFAAILSKGIAGQIKQGLYREYVPFTEDLSVLRGKLEFNSTIKNKLAHRQVLTCEHDDLSENNLFNKILKTTAYTLVKHAKVEEKYKSELKKNLLFFSNVDFINVSAIKWTSLNYQRNNHSYKMLMNVCYFVLEGLLYSDEKGNYKIANYLDEQQMSHLYEKFVLEYYKYHYNGIIYATSSQIKWNVDDGVIDFLPIMQSDIMLKSKGKTLIIDTKYYTHTMQTKGQYNSTTFHSHDLYQIFTYVKNADLMNDGSVAGMLLYAKTDEQVTPDNDFMMRGNKISVKTLDLNLCFPDIAKQLDDIAKSYFEL